MQDQNSLSWQDFGESIGNTVIDGIDFLGANLDANAANSAAIANLNQAQADAIRQREDNRKYMIKMAFTLAIVAILAIVAVKVGAKFIK